MLDGVFHNNSSSIDRFCQDVLSEKENLCCFKTAVFPKIPNLLIKNKEPSLGSCQKLAGGYSAINIFIRLHKLY